MTPDPDSKAKIHVTLLQYIHTTTPPPPKKKIVIIEILANRAFKDDWFNKEHSLHITKADLGELLNIATKNQLFQFGGNLYEIVDGDGMGSPHSYVVLKNNFKPKAECRISTNAMWTTRLA